MNFMVSGKLSGGDTELFRPIYNNLLQQDPYLLLKDFESYVDCQKKIHEVWKKPEEWTRKSILNVANIGKFSSDRSIREYCDNIWRVETVKVIDQKQV